MASPVRVAIAVAVGVPAASRPGHEAVDARLAVVERDSGVVGDVLHKRLPRVNDTPTMAARPGEEVGAEQHPAGTDGVPRGPQEPPHALAVMLDLVPPTRDLQVAAGVTLGHGDRLVAPQRMATVAEDQSQGRVPA